jgi:glycosyltransferase involved in cell wall biosynthesis
MAYCILPLLDAGKYVMKNMESSMVEASGPGILKAWVRRLRQGKPLPNPEDARAVTQNLNVDRYSEYINPVLNFYRDKAKKSLRVFYNLALQTGSLQIRDMFSKVASTEALDLPDLLRVLRQMRQESPAPEQLQTIRDACDAPTLLTLADLLANTARDDLDTTSAITLFEFVAWIFGVEVFSEQNRLQYVEALNELGHYSESEHLAGELNINSIAPLQRELLNLQRIRRTGSVKEWFSTLNAEYSSLGMTRVRLNDDETLPLLDRLSAYNPDQLTGPKISVIMPTYSPGPGIRTALRGLLEQRWQNLEIIIVDDASPEEFRNTFREIEQLDSRIHIIHQSHNQGSYVARNTGLRVATGEFITTHDDDDWSHPDKLSSQIKIMLENSDIVATTSAHIRTTEQLDFRRVNARAQFLQMNYSSLMFRRALLSQIGPWDTVNRGGDSEFYTRLKSIYGSKNVVGLHDRPFSFSRVWAGSLTSGEMSRGFFAYSRLLYRWAFRQWYWDVKNSGRLPVHNPDEPRPYAIPSSFAPGKRNKDLGRFDVIYVADFFRQAAYANRVVKEMESLSQSGLRVGYIHLYSPRTNKFEGIAPRLFELQLEGRITQVSYDDLAEANLLIIFDSSIGMFLDQLRSTVVSHRGVIVDNEPPALYGSTPRAPTDYVSALRNLERCFNTDFRVVGASRKDQKRIRDFIPDQRILSDTQIWHPHIRGAFAEVSLPNGRPVVGFHSYGNHYRWPSNLEEFELVYCSPNFATRFYGNVQSARKKFGSSAFASSEIVPYSQNGERNFLESIDFWVHFPNRRLEDDLWEPALKAMQAGKVVILPHHLEDYYGDSAVYSRPEEVESVVTRIARDAEAYRRQAERGQVFVARKASEASLVDRVTGLL